MKIIRIRPWPIVVVAAVTGALAVPVTALAGTSALSGVSAWTPPTPVAPCAPKVSDMPALCVTLADPDPTHNTQTYLDANKENTIPAAVNLVDPTNAANNLSYVGLEPTEIHGRGNSSWAMPKKPYQIKFDKKTSVLGMAKAKKWVLLANYTDPTFMRNAVALSLGKSLGLENSPEFSFVDLFINGSYRGNYMVAEKAEIGDSRVTPTGPQQVLIEMDNNHYTDEGYWATMPSGSHIVLKDANGSGGVPDKVLSGTQTALSADVASGWNAAKAAFTSFDTLLRAKDPTTGKPDWAALSALIDIDSFVKYYWVQEVTENFDLPKASVYFWMDPLLDNKIHAGPVWDFDLTLANFPTEQRGAIASADYAKNSMFYRLRDSHNVINSWYTLLYRNAEFAAAANTFYSAKVASAVKALPAAIDALAGRLANSAAANFVKWPVLGKTSPIAPTRTFGATYEAEVARLRTFVTDRTIFLDATNGAGFPLLQGGAFSTGKGWNVIQKNDAAGVITGVEQPAYVQSGQFIGPTGLASPLSAFRLNLVSSVPGALTANVHYASIGWTGVKPAAGTNLSPWTSWPQQGTPGANSIEAVQLQLTGELAQYFTLQYRAHVSSLGWLAWVNAGATAGTTGRGLAVESLQVRLFKKPGVVFPPGSPTSTTTTTAPSTTTTTTAPTTTTTTTTTAPTTTTTAPPTTTTTTTTTTATATTTTTTSSTSTSTTPVTVSAKYSAHVSSIGWMSTVADNAVAGTTGRALKMEALRLQIQRTGITGDISYRGHVSGLGWQPYVSSSTFIGTTGQARALEAFQITLTGDLATKYRIEYRAHVAGIGWQAYVADGAVAGTTGQARAIEAVQIRLVPKV
jgi:uncharacterized protein YjdB